MKTQEKILAGVGVALPLGYVIWEATRPKNGDGRRDVGFPAVAGRLPLERFWDAINAAAAPPVPPPTGEITFAQIHDRTADRRHDSPTFPVSIPLGNVVGVMARGRNTTNRTVILQIQTRLIDPTGRIVVWSPMRELSVPAGGEIDSYFTAFAPINLPGIWRIAAVLIAPPR
ncbi:MAG: hypothetical protein DDT26_02758 [Dehalococcoidia bacterium]|nr:hypothetical protein [Chloroflexota bacterium]